MGTTKSVPSNRGLRIQAKKCLYKGVIVPTALYGAETWGIRSAERKKVNVLEMKCLRSLVGVSGIDRITTYEKGGRQEGWRRSLLTTISTNTTTYHHHH